MVHRQAHNAVGAVLGVLLVAGLVVALFQGCSGNTPVGQAYEFGNELEESQAGNGNLDTIDIPAEQPLGWEDGYQTTYTQQEKQVLVEDEFETTLVMAESSPDSSVDVPTDVETVSSADQANCEKSGKRWEANCGCYDAGEDIKWHDVWGCGKPIIE